ncbi:MAG: hypothetical protein HQ495_08720 [Alphaproteobacteria bacterium]|nr:hypothetical protein [Alphaproteobacteria bacterium]
MAILEEIPTRISRIKLSDLEPRLTDGTDDQIFTWVVPDELKAPGDLPGKAHPLWDRSVHDQIAKAFNRLSEAAQLIVGKWNPANPDWPKLYAILAYHRPSDRLVLGQMGLEELAVYVEVAAENVATAPDQLITGTRKRGGSKPRSDPATDARIASDWKASQMTKKDFARHRGWTYDYVHKAIERHRKRK